MDFFSGFELFNNIDDVKSAVETTGFTFHPSGGYEGSKYVKATSTGASLTIPCTPGRTKVVGFWCKGFTRDYAVNSAISNYFIRFNLGVNSVTGAPTEYVGVHYTSKGLELSKYDGSLTWYAYWLNQIYPPLPENEWAHVQIKIATHLTTGEIEIRVNGVVELSMSTVELYDEDIVSISLNGGGSGEAGSGGMSFDNVWVADDFAGSLRATVALPVSDASVQFTPSTGSDNFAMIAETTPDGDNSYVSSTTVGHKDLYGFEQISTDVVVKVVSLVCNVRKKESDFLGIKLLAKQGATEYEVLVKDNISMAYKYHAQVLTAAPDATAWTTSKFNAVQWGFQSAV